MPDTFAPPRPSRLVAVALVLATLLVGCTSGATPGPSGAAPDAGGASPSAAVDTLVVRDPSQDANVPTYRRDAFGDGWDYDYRTGCNTRELVLIEESLVDPQVDDKCRSTAGSWQSAYDGVRTTDPADLQIDHMVPLSDAWRSGAASWTDDRRRTFANDLTDAATLIAVTGSTNQSKGDSSPDEWMPPDRGAWCDYAANWVAVKARWELSVTGSEKAVLVQVLSGC